MKLSIRLTLLTVCLAALAFAGCNSESEQPAATSAGATPAAEAAEGGKYLLDVEPAEAAEVIAARKDSQDKEEVVVVGRIGGSVDPWIADRAAFSIVDSSLKACSDVEGDNCPTPWDYCCATGVPEATALVKVVDAGGNLVKKDARRLLGVKELQTVVVRGKAQRDESGNLTILATGVYVKK